MLRVLVPLFDYAGANEFGVIALDSDEILIGRDALPFAKLPEEMRAQLRPYHARIVRKGGEFILINEGAPMDTRYNGEQVVGSTVALRVGDQLQFGVSLAFEFRDATGNVDPEGTQVLAVPVVSARLVLYPRSVEGPTGQLAIDEFPFLISKTQGPFAEYAKAHPSALSFLSRRHARIVERGDGLFVEDLGSTNGTHLNGSLLRQAALPLRSGDQVCFGHRDFTFEALIKNADSTVVEEKLADPNGTVLISSARPFLELYCDTGDTPETANGADADGRGSATAGVGSEQTAWRDRVVAAFRSTAAQRWWRALPIGRWPRLAVVWSLPALAIALLVSALFSDTRPERIRELLQEQRPREALVIAAAYVNDNPADAVAPGLLAEAYEEHLVPLWLTAMLRDDTAEAKLAMADAIALAPGQVNDPLSTLLGWMTALADYAKSHNGQAKVSLAHDNVELRQLFQHWDSRSDVYERLLRRLEETSPDLADVHAKALSQLRALQEDGSVLLGAVDELQRRLGDYIDEGRIESAIDRLKGFDQEFPRVVDRDRFRADLDIYAALLRAFDQGDLELFVHSSLKLPFDSTFFRERQQALTEGIAEAERANDRYEEASRLWRQGQLEEAVKALSTGGASRWESTLTAKKQRFEHLLVRVQGLQALVDTPRFAAELIDLYAALDPEEDAFIYNSMADDFAMQRKDAIQRAQALTEIAAQSWKSYRDAYDGVSGGLRLEPEVSDRFRRQVLLLGAAYADVDQSLQLYRLLEIDGPEDAENLHSLVVVEIRQQRNALEALRSILDRNVVEEKLQLLPLVKEPRS